MLHAATIRRSTLGSLAVLVALPIWAGENPTLKDNPITREQADEMIQELKQIRQLLERNAAAAAPSPKTAPKAQPPQPAAQAKLKIEGGYVLGSPDAPLTMIEYSDAQCPFCQRFQTAAFAEIKKNYIDTGKLRFISRDMPLDFHPNAMRAAEAARCAGEENHYWEMRETLMNNASKLSEEDILGYAGDLHLNAAQFKACLASGKYKASIGKDAAEAATLNIAGTPSFVVGRTTAEGVDGVVVVGALPYAAFEAKFKEVAAR